MTHPDCPVVEVPHAIEARPDNRSPTLSGHSGGATGRVVYKTKGRVVIAFDVPSRVLLEGPRKKKMKGPVPLSKSKLLPRILYWRRGRN